MLSREPSAWKCHVMEMSSEIHSLDQKLQERVTWEPTVPYTSRCVYTWMEDVGDGPARGTNPSALQVPRHRDGAHQQGHWPICAPSLALCPAPCHHRGLLLAPEEEQMLVGDSISVPLWVPLQGPSTLVSP